ncbi:MAG: hypothetical protein J4G12_06590 [Gemmatimonadetes bacterium]|nr:hypothetical protein [Gemmatimonadota bacterium]
MSYSGPGGLLKSSNHRTIAVCVVVLVVLAAGTAWAAKSLFDQEQLKVYAHDGWCPRGTRQQVEAGLVVPGHTAVLIDTSNRISAADGSAAYSAIDAVLRDTVRTPHLQKVSVFGLPESEHERADGPERSLCVPLQGHMADLLYQNPRIVELDFRDFVGVVKVRLDSLLARDEAPSSPIVETMNDLVGRDEEIDSFIIVSDMLQNTSTCDLYTGECDMLRTCAPIREGGIGSVHVYYVDRRIAAQSTTWPDPNWSECLGSIPTSLLN